MKSQRFRVAVTLFVLGVSLGAGARASAYFAESDSGDFALATAGEIGPPMSFTATATSGSSTNLSWVAPTNPSPTGYMLSQSSGTLEGCASNPSAGTTSCTATGLTPGVDYSWTLVALYDSWSSTPVEAVAVSPPAQTPEVSVPALLPAIGGGIMAAVLIMRRGLRKRRRRPRTRPGRIFAGLSGAGQ